MRTSHASAGRRFGMSLIELLVVVAIIITMSTIALRTFTPSLKDRQVREASRVVSAALQAARAKALQTGRRHGLVLERLTVKTDSAGTTGAPGVRILPTACRRMYTVAAQPPYQGDYLDSVATFRYATSNFGLYNLIRLGATTRLNPSDGSMLNAGDLDWGWDGVRINDVILINGAAFTITAAPSVDSYTGRILAPPSVSAPWTMTNNNTNYNPIRGRPSLFPDPTAGWVVCDGPYQLARPPVRLAGTDVELPEGSAISMESSGWHDNCETYDINMNYTGRTYFPAGLRGLGSAGDPNQANQDVAGFEAYTDLPAVIWFGPDGGMVELWYGGWAKSGAADGLFAKYALTSAPSKVLATPIEPSGRLMTQLTKTPLSQALLLLVCPIEQCDYLPFASGSTIKQPWMDLSNRWIALNPVTGRVQTFEVFLPSSTAQSYGYPQNIGESRWLARRGSGISGN